MSREHDVSVTVFCFWQEIYTSYFMCLWCLDANTYCFLATNNLTPPTLIIKARFHGLYFRTVTNFTLIYSNWLSGVKSEEWLKPLLLYIFQ